jgi:hypothetical protein
LTIGPLFTGIEGLPFLHGGGGFFVKNEGGLVQDAWYIVSGKALVIVQFHHALGLS